MDYTFEPISVVHREVIIDIFNYYVEHSFAAYPEHRLPYEFFDRIMAMGEGYPNLVAKDKNSNVIGFGMLRAYHPMPTFLQTAEITYFISPEHTGKGIGTSLLEYLANKAAEMKITSILASISSRNIGSIEFHKKHGFRECGIFKSIGRKKKENFDVVWMQKIL